MEKEDKIVVEASGEFPFQFFIEKATASIEDEAELILEGIASTTNLDHDSERMSESAIRAMEAAINDQGVPLRVEHQKEDEAVIGKVFKAWVDERNQLHIQAQLDKSHPVSPILYSSMKQGAKMGLSVGGFVKRAVRELSEKTGKMVKTFYDVALKEVSVTPRPANYDSWLVAKSIVESEGQAEGFRKHALYNEFLFENPKLDYLKAFAKSIPDEAWHKVASQDTNEDSMETKKTEETTDPTEKAVSRAEFSQLSSLVTKGFESMTALMSKALHIDAEDQAQPMEAKPEPEKVTAKAEDALDQVNPDEKKPDVGGDEAAKSTERPATQEEANGTDVNGGREKTSDKDETEKASTDEYDLQTVEEAIKSMSKLQARLAKTEETETEKTTDDETKEKTSDKDETEKAEESTETEKGIHPIDVFVATVTKTIEMMAEKMEKSGKSIPGFEKSIINQIREDSSLQEEIAKMLKVPGFKKSVSMGTPYVATKDGRRFALVMAEAGAPIVEKSAKEKVGAKSFRDAWKADYSPAAGE